MLATDGTGWRVTDGDGTILLLTMVTTKPQGLTMRDITWTTLQHDQHQAPVLDCPRQRPWTWTVSPALPGGLLFYPETGTVGMEVGVDQRPIAKVEYTLTVRNAAGQASTTLLTHRGGTAPRGCRGFHRRITRTFSCSAGLRTGVSPTMTSSFSPKLVEELAAALPPDGANPIGNNARLIMVNKIRGLTPGHYSQMFGTGPAFRSVFFPGYVPVAAEGLFGGLTGIGDEYLSQAAIGLLCHQMHTVTTDVRRPTADQRHQRQDRCVERRDPEPNVPLVRVRRLDHQR